MLALLLLAGSALDLSQAAHATAGDQRTGQRVVTTVVSMTVNFSSDTMIIVPPKSLAQSALRRVLS